MQIDMLLLNSIKDWRFIHHLGVFVSIWSSARALGSRSEVRGFDPRPI